MNRTDITHHAGDTDHGFDGRPFGHTNASRSLGIGPDPEGYPSWYDTNEAQEAVCEAGECRHPEHRRQSCDPRFCAHPGHVAARS